MLTNLFFVLFISSLLHSHTASAALNDSPTIKRYNVVRHYGAIGDGKTDSTQAFLNAWNAACASLIPPEIIVPKGDFLLKPIIFNGPCKLSVSFTIRGTLLTNEYNSDSWITFKNVDGLHITGGVLDANGKTLWDCKTSGGSCPKGAMSFNIVGSKNIIVDGLTSKNSQVFHIVLYGSENINMEGITIIADGNSPNTDGIHIQNTKEVTITNSQMMTGDDCISLAGNIQNVWIENVHCGPGHGISIGSLGHEGDEGILVQNVTIKSTTFTDTLNGVRIKTLSTPINGNVKDIYFIGATMNNSYNPILIDQNYCPSGKCEKGEGSNIQMSNIVYNNIHGTSASSEIINFDCSPKKSCTALQLQDIQLSYQSGAPKCVNRNTEFSAGSTIPSNCEVVTNNIA
ncbi:hypothetical protein vseg_008493 [Gypsophila vaccaria]